MRITHLIILSVALVLVSIPVKSLSMISIIGEPFEEVKIDPNLEIQPSFEKGDLKLIFDNKRALSISYKWNIAICSEKDIGLKYPHGLMEKLGLPADWCKETDFIGYSVAFDLSKSEIPYTITIKDLPLTDNYIYYGNGTGVIIATGPNNAEDPRSNKIVRHLNGSLEMCIKGASNDLNCFTSENNGSTWQNTIELCTGTADFTNLYCNSQDVCLICWKETAGYIGCQNKTTGTTQWASQQCGKAQNWTDKGPTNASWSTGLLPISLTVCPDDSFHGVINPASVNGSTGNDWLLYFNWTPNQGFAPRDQTPTTGGFVFNGTWINSNAANDSTRAQITCDSNNNVYVIAKSTDGGSPAQIFSSRNSFSQRLVIPPSPIGAVGEIGKIAYDYLNNRIAIPFGDGTHANLRIYMLNDTNGWNNTGNWTSINMAVNISVQNGSTNTFPWLGFSYDQLWYGFSNNESDNNQNVSGNFMNSSANASTWTVTYGYYKDSFTTNGWTVAPYTSCLYSAYPSWDRINESLGCVYLNDTGAGATLFWDWISVSYHPPASAPGALSLMNFTRLIVGQNAVLRLGVNTNFQLGGSA